MDHSDNVLSADNQQERLFAAVLNEIPSDFAWYVTGFTDGERNFDISFTRDMKFHNPFSEF